jgi:hypothetical protein
MRNKQATTFSITVALAGLIGLTVFAQQDRYTLKVPMDSHSPNSKDTTSKLGSHRGEAVAFYRSLAGRGGAHRGGSNGERSLVPQSDERTWS